MSRDIKMLVIHHSYSLWADAAEINCWHIARGWKGIGYHKVILNGFPSYTSWAKGLYKKAFDGKIEQGRPDTEVGAHTVGHNRDSIGICLIGNFDSAPPKELQWNSLVDCCVRLCQRHNLKASDIHGHREFAPKSCPGTKFDMKKLVKEVAQKLASATGGK